MQAQSQGEIKKRETPETGSVTGSVNGINFEVPPRPDTAGLRGGKQMHLIGKYYQENAAAIIADVERLGEEATRERWSIPVATWPVLRARLMPDKFPMPNWWKKLKKRGRKADPENNVEKLPKFEPAAPPLSTSSLLKEVSETRAQPAALRAIDARAYLPAWNEAWQPEVKIKWLEVYQALALNGVKAE